MLHSYPKILPLVGKYAGLVLGRPVEVTETEEECKADFMEKLYAIHRKSWLSRITSGFPEFYKRWLLTHDNQVQE